jgi:hypothetical protein
VLIGTRKLLPYGAGVVQPGDVTLRILKPIETSQLSLKDRGALTDRVRSLILEKLAD